MLKWIKDVYLKYTKKERSLLVLDSFRGHLTDDVKKAFRKGNTVMAVIPGGCTSKVQPLDVSINKPFKVDLRRSWGSYMRQSSKEARETGDRVKAATKEQVLSWIQCAVKSIQDKPDLVRKSFKVCGIRNRLNGSEDNQIRSEVADIEMVDSENEEEEFEGFDFEDLSSALEKLRE